MLYNSLLVSDYLGLFSKGKDLEAAKGLVDQYETACHLSKGPDKKRAAHWESKARDLESKMERKVEKTEEALVS